MAVEAVETNEREDDLELELGGIFDEKTAARIMRCNHQTLARARKKGLLPFYRIGRIVRYDDKCLAEFKRRTQKNVAA